MRTEHHQVLERDVGTWDVTSTSRFTGQEGAARGVEVGRLIENGLWLIKEIRTEFEGGTFEGHAIFGYDPERKKYVGAWVDSFNPYLLRMEGTLEGNTLTMEVEEGYDYGGLTKTRQRQVLEWQEDGERVWTLYQPQADGTEVSMLEVRARRRE